MLPRQLIPFSLRHCKCLFVSILFVCAVMALTAIHLRPNLLVDKIHSLEGESIRKALAFDLQKHGRISTDEETPGVSKFSESVQFLPETEASIQEADVHQVNYKSYGSPNSQHQVVPTYVPIEPEVSQGDIPGVVKSQSGTRQLPPGVYLSQDQMQAKTPAKTPDPFVPERRLIHFDLKGAPPKMSYLQEIIPIIAQLGATGLLVEYEDMFPYEGILKSVAATNHYTQAEIKSLLETAYENKLEVIPLVQTFGHLEYVLKYEHFAHLRENPGVPQAICPSRNDSFILVQNLIDQIMVLHPGIRYIHIGCDEVFHMAECSLCATKMKDDLFLAHVNRVASYVRTKYNVVPIIWDDMLRHISAAAMNEYKLGDLVEPMVWVYAEDIYRFAGAHVFDQYSQVFPSFWISSAFKGAFGETLVVPDVSRHLENNLNWLQTGRAESPKFRQGLRGLAITGWQRYDHFAVLCELLPASIPSMAVTLLATSKGYYNQSLAPALYSALSCSRSSRNEKIPDLHYDAFLYDKMSMCFFPGAQFFKLTARFIRTEREVDEFVKLTTRRKGWLTDYNVRHNFSSPARIDELTRDLPYLSGSVHTLARQTIEAMKHTFDGYTVSEWLEQKLLPLLDKLDAVQKSAQQMLMTSHWPNRPLKPFDRWNYYSIKLDDIFNNNTRSAAAGANP